jgi:hypothetical protein
MITEVRDQRSEVENLVGELNSTLMPPKLRKAIMASFRPIEIARIIYRKAGIDFEKARDEHLEDGSVIALPWLFMMFSAVQLEQGPAWQIDVAVGNLAEVCGRLPFYLPYVVFYRRLDRRPRVLKLDRAARLIARMSKESRKAGNVMREEPTKEEEIAAVRASAARCEGDWHVFHGGLPQPNQLCKCGQKMATTKLRVLLDAGVTAGAKT